MFHPHDDVTVHIYGRDHQGEVLHHRNGWIECRIIIDPEWDYGSLTSRLDPTPIVCVRTRWVRHADNPEQHCRTNP